MNKTVLLAISLFLVAVFSGCFGGGDEEPAASWTVTVTHADGTQSSHEVQSWDLGTDRDKDDMADQQEMLQKTDPDDPDTDGDGLLDGPSVTVSSDDERAEEWIDLGIVYIENGSGGYDFQGEYPHGSTVLKADSDEDGIPDGEEVRGYTVDVLGEERFVQTSPRSLDTSGDGIPDGVSRAAGLDPTTRDTDGDGVEDHNDLDPFRDLEIGFNVASIELTGDGASRSIYFHVQIPGDPYISDVVPVPRGEETSGDPFDSPLLDADDRGGSFMGGEFNLTFSVTALAEEGGETVRVDLFSGTTGSESVIGRFDVRTGVLRILQGGETVAWPDRFEGQDGRVDLGLDLPGEPWGKIQRWGPQP